MGCRIFRWILILFLIGSTGSLFAQGGIFDTPSAPEPEEPKKSEPVPKANVGTPTARSEEKKDHKDFTAEKHSGNHLLESPAGLMGTHIHEPGKIMVEYRYMMMGMSGLYQGGQTISPMIPLMIPHQHPAYVTGMSGMSSNSAGTSTYNMVPNRMNMEMQMVNVMAAISENLSVMFMIPYVRNSMEMLNAGTFLKTYMSSSGVGDIQGQITYRFLHKENHNLLFNFGLSFPTGSIDQTDSMGPGMGMIRAKVPYNMQPGTGTYNPSPGITYTGNSGKFFWGSQMFAALRNAKNDNGYKFGNRYESSLWAGFKVSDWVSLLGRLQYQKWDNITGVDISLDQNMDPQNDPNRQGGRRALAYAGLNLKLPFSSESETRINFEFGAPFYQHLNGPQLGLKSAFNLTAQFLF